jgi:hypothetical protein
MLKVSTRFCRHARLTIRHSNVDVRNVNGAFGVLLSNDVSLHRQQSTSAVDVGSKTVKKSFPSPAELRNDWQKRRVPLFEVDRMKDLVSIN